MSPLDWLRENFLALLGAILGGGLVSLLNAKAQRDKIKSETLLVKAQRNGELADAVGVLSDAAVAMVEPMQRQLLEAAEEYARARAEVDKLATRCRDVTAELQAAYDTIEQLETALVRAQNLIAQLEEQRSDLLCQLQECRESL